MVSKIWKHFLKEKKNEKFVRTCIVCGFELSTPKDGSTSNMFNHLKAKHFKEFEFLINEDNKNTVVLHYYNDFVKYIFRRNQKFYHFIKNLL